MNTLSIEKALADKYRYAPLPKELSEKYRELFTDNIPGFLSIDGSDEKLYTSKGTVICDGYNRIVIGDYGAFVEFVSQPDDVEFIIQPGQEYRVNDKKYSTRIKYVWLTINDGSGIKIYKQKRPVTYADYVPKMYYVSVHECFRSIGGDA